MASAYIQQRNEITKALRSVRSALRSNDTLGEQIERTLDRLIKRKTIITPDQMQKTVEKVQAFVDMAQRVSMALNLVFNVMK